MTTPVPPPDQTAILPAVGEVPLGLRLRAAIYRRLPVMGGHLRLTPATVRAQLDAIDGDVLATLRNGLRMPVDPRDYNGRELFLFGAPDRRIVALCRALLRSGDVFLDLGANHGSVGLLCMDRITPGGEVHLVEPQPDLNARINACLATRSGLPVQLHGIGLWDEDGELALARPTGHSGAASFVDGVISDEDADHTRVPVRDITAWVTEVAGDRPCGAKVDVEGAEAIIVPALLARPNVRFIAFECKHEETRMPIRDAAAAAGCSIFGLERTVLRLRICPVTSLDDFDRYTDFVAFPARPDAASGGSAHPRACIVD